MEEINEARPPKVDPKIRSSPRIRQLYWCDFPKDAELPEFWKRRPVVVVSFRNTLSGSVTVIPFTSQDQSKNKWAIEVKDTITKGYRAWAVCDKPYTVAVSRLYPDRRPNTNTRLNEQEFNLILLKLLEWLPKIEI